MRLISILAAFFFTLSIAGVSAAGQGRGNGQAKKQSTQTTKAKPETPRAKTQTAKQAAKAETRTVKSETHAAKSEAKTVRNRRDGDARDGGDTNHTDNAPREKSEARSALADDASARHNRAGCDGRVQELGAVCGRRSCLEQSRYSVRRSESEDDRHCARSHARNHRAWHADVARSGHPESQGRSDA